MRWSRVRISSGPFKPLGWFKIAKKNETQHVLIPKHEKLSEKASKELMDQYKIGLEDLPRISMKDPAIAHMDLSSGDIVKITRKSSTSGMTEFFRRVVK